MKHVPLPLTSEKEPNHKDDHASLLPQIREPRLQQLLSRDQRLEGEEQGGRPVGGRRDGDYEAQGEAGCGGRQLKTEGGRD